MFSARLVVARMEEQITTGVFTNRWQLKVEINRDFAAKERVWHARHDTSTIAVACIGTGRTSMRHVAQKQAGL